MSGNVDDVIASLEEAAVGLEHPHELVCEGLVNRFFATFGSLVTNTGEATHVAVDSQAALALGLACIQRRMQVPSSSPDSSQISQTMEAVETCRVLPHVLAEPIAYELFANVVRDDAPLLAGGRNAERLAELLEVRAEALSALRKKCKRLALHLAESDTGRPDAVDDIIDQLQEEAAAVKQTDRKATKKALQQLIEDPTVWTLVPGLLLASASSAVLSAPTAIALLARIGSLAVKARRERNESVNASDMRFLYYLARQK